MSFGALGVLALGIGIVKWLHFFYSTYQFFVHGTVINNSLFVSFASAQGSSARLVHLGVAGSDVGMVGPVCHAYQRAGIPVKSIQVFQILNVLKLVVAGLVNPLAPVPKPNSEFFNSAANALSLGYVYLVLELLFELVSEGVHQDFVNAAGVVFQVACEALLVHVAYLVQKICQNFRLLNFFVVSEFQFQVLAR